jgi:excisionase family DNA binding protein
MTVLMNTKEVAAFLHINEKKVYTLIDAYGLPATKITGKWLFPKHLVEQWLENHTINYPERQRFLLKTPALFVIAGSNDILLDRSIQLFMKSDPQYTAVFGNLGSMGGIRALKQGLCHVATSHLSQEDGQDFNFAYAATEMDHLPAVINFCHREQGLLVARSNPHAIREVADIQTKGLRLVNRQPGTGTRLWFEQALKKAGIAPSSVKGFDHEVQRHLEVGIEILSGRADVGPGIRSVAALLELDFIPFHWERFDLLINKDRFFDKNIQSFLTLLHEQPFRDLVADLSGYDLSATGKMVYPSVPFTRSQTSSPAA